MVAPSLVPSKPWPTRARGATIRFTSQFYDAYNHNQTPTEAQVIVSYVKSDGTPGTATIPMTNTGPNGSWIADWDSRGAAAGIVYWSVETPGSPPVSVEDGQFTLEANAANQPTF